MVLFLFFFFFFFFGGEIIIGVDKEKSGKVVKRIECCSLRGGNM